MYNRLTSVIPLGTAQTQLVSQRAAKSRNSLHLAQAALRRLHIHCAHSGARKCVSVSLRRVPRAARRRSCMAPPMRRESYTGAGT